MPIVIDGSPSLPSTLNPPNDPACVREIPSTISETPPKMPRMYAPSDPPSASGFLPSMSSSTTPMSIATGGTAGKM